jgi:hypothetical protein
LESNEIRGLWIIAVGNLVISVAIISIFLMVGVAQRELDPLQNQVRN